MSLKTELTFGCDRKALEKVSPEATDEVHYDFFCGRRPNAFSLPVRYANRRRGRVAAPKSKTQPGWSSKVGCLHHTPQTARIKWSQVTLYILCFFCIIVPVPRTKQALVSFPGAARPQIFQGFTGPCISAPFCRSVCEGKGRIG